jgi:alkanesulfonate monooxygenase SsuD/methylene tetrahydromethanopterin reductase-like flavin-dependent oxidoreductase (luciferase family)
MARLADRAGYDAVWVGGQRGGQAAPGAVTTLAVLAGITERGAARHRRAPARPPPSRRPRQRDRERGQHLAGRVVLGLGVGWSLPSAEREWAACGADHKRRVRRLEEHVEIWRMLWGGEPVTRRGEDFELTEHTIGPLPWNPAGPPVLITAANRGEMLPPSSSGSPGSATASSPPTSRPRTAASCASAPSEALARHGRSLPGFPLCVYTTVRFENDVRTAERRTGSSSPPTTGAASTCAAPWALGPPDAVIDALRRYAAAGVTDLCLRFVGDDQFQQFERFTAEVLPALTSPA